jgi:hypothetical protein
LEEVIELQYHSEHNREFLFKCYWYDIIDKKIKVDPFFIAFIFILGAGFID